MNTPCTLMFACYSGAMIVTLIGMPGSGKTTIGNVLAAELGWSFIDTDELVATLHGISVRDMVATGGEAALRRAEREVILQLPIREPAIVATGGSVVYSQRAMAHLATLGPIVWLEAPIAVLKQRIGDPRKRGVLMGKHTSLESLYEAREPLYSKYATYIQSTDMQKADVVHELRDNLHL